MTIATMAFHPEWRVDVDHDLLPGKKFAPPAASRGEVDWDPPSRGMGIDATMRFKPRQFPPRNRVGPELAARVEARWEELGLS